MPDTANDALSPLSAAILFSLAGGASHGYAIIKQIEEMTEGETRVNTGSMYLALRRLLGDGLIEEAEGDSSDTRRRYYKLTQTGREAAKSEARRLAQLVRAAATHKLIPKVAS